MNLRLQAVLASIAVMLLMALGVIASNNPALFPTTARFWFGIVLIVIGIGSIALRIPVLPHYYFLQMVSSSSQSTYKQVVRDGVLISLGGLALVGLYYGDKYYNSLAAQVQYAKSFERGIEASKVRDWPAAIDAFSEATRWDPSNAIAHYNLGLMHLNKMDNEDAIISFGETIRLDPNFAKAYRARSMAYDRIGNKAQAEEDMKKAVSLDPRLAPGFDGPPPK
jgi:tetratricopeptide (TPR) repeat protein